MSERVPDVGAGPVTGADAGLSPAGVVDVEQITTTVEPVDADTPVADAAAAPVPGGTTAETNTAPGEYALVARAQDGDTDAFEHLVHAYQAQLFRLAYRMLNDRVAAEDAVQDVFVTVWRRLPTLQDPQAFRAWVFHIATRRCLNVLRLRARRRTDVVAGEDVETESEAASLRERAGRAEGDPAAEAQARATRLGLDEALAQLPSDQRACWVLHEMHDLSYQAIAYAIGVPLSTVRGRISRARQNLMEGMSSWR